ncbi:hypothetical protein [Streptomyces violens]|uniref:hypothetical protein n=1 Tax=Streptomyces violens TaxID=66377 RepID=UPI0004BEDA30|nr:hypothetical protein [Streptomyces violens]
MRRCGDPETTGLALAGNAAGQAGVVRTLEEPPSWVGKIQIRFWLRKLSSEGNAPGWYVGIWQRLHRKPAGPTDKTR